MQQDVGERLRVIDADMMEKCRTALAVQKGGENAPLTAQERQEIFHEGAD